MDASHGSSSNSPPPFLTKTYDMIDDPSTNSIVSWNPENNSSFIVWNHLDFARDLLPMYFKHNNFSSFVRQLNTYGFRKMDPDRWEFGNEEFIRGQKHLLRNIHRRKPIYSHSLHTAGPLTEPERQELEENINKLIQDKSILLLDFKKQAQFQDVMENQMQSLEQRLLHVEARQKNLISKLNRFVQKPGFLSSVSLAPDLHGKKRRLPKYDFIFEDNRIVTKDDAADMTLMNTDAFEKMESSLNSLESLFREASDSLPLPAAAEQNTPASSASLASSSSTSNRGSPDASAAGDEGGKLPQIDVNAEPSGRGVNDVFWEQFLTESPVVMDVQEVQSERRGGDDPRSDWWKRNGSNVDTITKKMGSLASVERT